MKSVVAIKWLGRSSIFWIYIGTVLALKVSGQNVSYLYDSQNRITNVSYSSGGSFSYSYDKAGNRLLLSSVANTVGADVVAPPTPSKFSASPHSVSQVILNWMPVGDLGGAGLAGYKVFQNGIFLGNTSSTNYTVEGLRYNTRYCFSIAAFDNASNVSSVSSEQCTETFQLEAPLLTPLKKELPAVFQFTFSSVIGAKYRIQSSDDLKSWVELSNFFGNGAPFSFNNTLSSNYQFFRIISP